jgi:hypothetical protein
LPLDLGRARASAGLPPLGFAEPCYAGVAGHGSEQVLQIGLHGDTGRVHRALDVERKVPFEIIAINRKGPEAFIPATVQVNFFTDLNPVLLGIGGRIRSHVKVVEFIMGPSGLLPYP